ncbi:branched-chain alpha-keto acid dehydrogenase E2 subunit [Rhodobacterales bacterium HTCC2150]|nr:branched-chain alpha-keto acid dehydrogenase E2 subunit [Rhodobacterales bacterium HTCC2150] [Rhodobacteraceae bacterium HTCC2150]
MPTEILMPALSPTMEEGTLAKWLVKAGDTVNSGDLIAEIETDKATMEFEAVDEGVISELLVAEGSEGVAVNTAIAILLVDGEEAGTKPTAKPKETAAAPAPAASVSAVVSSVSPQPLAEKGDRVFATPLARRIAKQNGVDLGAVSGSGPHGRIIKADVEGLSATAAPVATSTAPAAKQEIASSATSDSVKAMYADREYKEIPLNGMRKIIAGRLTEAKQTIPHFYLRRDILLDELLAFRSTLNKKLAAREIKLSVNDFIIKACALALQDVPAANAVWAEDRVLQMVKSDVAVAVAIDGGLFTPVLQDSDTKTLSTLSTEMKDLAARARDKKLAPHEYQGGSFAISNLGMMGVDNFDAVINPPHGAILAVGAGKRKPVVGPNGDLTSATVMSVTLSVDHRVIDGALGAELLQSIVDYLESPIAMLA